MPRSIDSHAPDCPCNACRGRRQGGRSTEALLVRLPQDLAAWVRQRGGPGYLRQLAEEARKSEGSE